MIWNGQTIIRKNTKEFEYAGKVIGQLKLTAVKKKIEKRIVREKLCLPKGIIILDGATGSELDRRGVDVSRPLWSANANIVAPDVLK